MNLKLRNGFRTWIEIDRKAIAHNYRIFRSLVSKKTKLMAVVKSNAYGHNLFEFAKEMEKFGADSLAVDSVIEGLALRKAGIKIPILILGYTLPGMLERAIAADLELTISSFEALAELEKYAKHKPKVHIKVDTGMHRQGFLAEDLPKILGKLKVASGKLQVAGLYTHFASAKNPAFPQDTKAQIEEFKKWVEAFHQAGFRPTVHAAATAGTLLFPESHFDMVRIGIGLYGLWPAREVEAFLHDEINLKPVLTWKTIVSEVKVFKKGGRVGYDLTEALPSGAKIAICPVGYWHGYPRALSSIGRVLVNGQMAKIVGRVSMDMITIDVSKIPKMKVGDEVVLIGEGVPAEEMAYLSDSSWYEIITRLNPLIERIYR